MILHIVVDDAFIDYAYDAFEAVAPGQSAFILVSRNKKKLHIRKAQVSIVSPFEFLSRKFASSLLSYDFVVLHWLDAFKKQLVLNAPDRVKFLWIGWGGDYYCYVDKVLLLPETRRISIETNIFKKLKGYMEKKVFFNKTEKIINRINFFAPVLEEDYNLLKNAIHNFRPIFISWNYGTLDNLIPDKDASIKGTNILVGNSATPENNHVEAFELISKLDLKNRKIFVPMSYGKLNYRKKIIEIGQKKFGDKFITLTSFVPIEEYVKIIASCSIVVMNHRRQQALGNIVIMMYLGAKIFLNKDNPIYNFLKKERAIIFSMEELTNTALEMSLTMEEIFINRNILEKYWSAESIKKRTKVLIDTIKKLK